MGRDGQIAAVTIAAAQQTPRSFESVPQPESTTQASATARQFLFLDTRCRGEKHCASIATRASRSSRTAGRIAEEEASGMIMIQFSAKAIRNRLPQFAFAAAQ